MAADDGSIETPTDPIDGICNDAARGIVAIWTEFAKDEPLNDIHTLMRVADKLDCYVAIEICSQSTYCKVNGGPWRGAIHLDALLDENDQVGDMAHELCHHTLYWYDIYVPGDGRVIQMEDWGELEERICREVSEMISAVPAGLQWNGKLKIPVGLGYVRRFEKTRAPAPSQSIPPGEWDEE